jgi:hypothetical protein
MRRIRILVAATTLVVLVAACSSSGTPAPSSTAAGGGGNRPTTQPSGGGASGAAVADPCSLLTPAQVSAVVGLTVGAGDSGGDTHSCDWSHPDSNGVPDEQVLLSTNEDPGLCGEGSSASLGITVTPVSGVGDQACMQQASGLQAGDNLTFYKNGLGFSIGVSGKTATFNEAMDRRCPRRPLELRSVMRYGLGLPTEQRLHLAGGCATRPSSRSWRSPTSRPG